MGPWRGSLQVNIELGGLLSPIFRLLTPVLQLLVGDLTAQNELFDQLGYFASEWTGSAWYGSAWYGSAWYGSAWYGSAWYGR